MFVGSEATIAPGVFRGVLVNLKELTDDFVFAGLGNA